MSELVRSLNFSNIYFRNHTFKKADIKEAIDHLAKFINRKIISPSPFVMLTAYNHIKTVIAYYAILKAGKIVVILDPATKTLELTEMIADVDPAAIIFMNVNTLKWNYEEEIVFRRYDKNFVVHSDLKDVCTVAFTNAEDGFAKGAMLTEKNLLSEIRAIVEIERVTKVRTYCTLVPYSHLIGLMFGMLMPCFSGCSILLPELELSYLSDNVKKIHEYNVTDFYSVPSLYYLLSKIKNLDKYFKNVSCVSGGAKLTPLVYESFYNCTGIKIREGYGLTETSPASTIHNRNSQTSVDSVGQPFPCCDIKIVNDKGEECEIGEIGEISIKGDNVFIGYFNNEQATDNVLKDGWFLTGDYGKADKMGNIYFCGLKKNMINVAGNNIYPSALKRYLMMNNNVHSVTIFSVQSTVNGRKVGANIELIDNSKSAQENFKKWCNENIRSIILPKLWHFE